MDWKKLAALGINIAPYAAAPFTSGASLAFIPAAAAGSAALTADWGDNPGGSALNTGLAALGGIGGGAGSDYIGKSVSGISDALGKAGQPSVMSRIAEYAQNPEFMKAAGGVAVGGAMQLENERNKRAITQGADFRRMQQADYLKNSQPYVPTAGLPSYGLTTQPSSAARQSAAGLSDALIKRLDKGTDMGLLEKLARLGGTAASVYGSRNDIR